MANDLYRGYEIVPCEGGGYMWKDERGFEHFGGQAHRVPYASPERAMDDIDRYKRNMAKGV